MEGPTLVLHYQNYFLFLKKKNTNKQQTNQTTLLYYVLNFVAVCDRFLDVDNTCILSCKRVNEVLTSTVFKYKEGLVMNLCYLIALDLDIQVYTYQIPILYLNKKICQTQGITVSAA